MIERKEKRKKKKNAAVFSIDFLSPNAMQASPVGRSEDQTPSACSPSA
jgi:hypothetical protein